MLHTPHVVNIVPASQPVRTRIPTTKDILSNLETQALAADEQAFVAFVDSLDWAKYPPQMILRAIDLALNLNLPSVAIDLAQKGRTLFSEDPDLQRAAYVLRTPVVQSTDKACNRGLKASRAWLQEYAHQYRGKWVAVDNGQLLCVADSLKLLQENLFQNSASETTLITRIL